MKLSKHTKRNRTKESPGERFAALMDELRRRPMTKKDARKLKALIRATHVAGMRRAARHQATPAR